MGLIFTNDKLFELHNISYNVIASDSLSLFIIGISILPLVLKTFP